LSIVPHLIGPIANVSVQAFALSVTNAVLCYIVYAVAELIAIRSSQMGTMSLLRTRIAEGEGVILPGGIALKLALAA
jgi:hypothetical protein